MDCTNLDATMISQQLELFTGWGPCQTTHHALRVQKNGRIACVPRAPPDLRVSGPCRRQHLEPRVICSSPEGGRRGRKEEEEKGIGSVRRRRGGRRRRRRRGGRRMSQDSLRNVLELVDMRRAGPRVRASALVHWPGGEAAGIPADWGAFPTRTTLRGIQPPVDEDYGRLRHHPDHCK